ncbi:MAG: hypothetical protein K8M05_04980 [Deltaproteobacteria bacterium]|nr:hypothetical protein [Kofleriaceae bacterium]
MIRLLVACLALVVLVACDEAPTTGTSAGSASASAADDAAVTAPIDAAAAAATSSPDVAAAASSAKVPGVFAVGDLVSAKWEDGYWYPGKIAAVNADGTYKIKYSDGDVSPKQKAKHIKHRKPSTGGGGSASGGCGSGKMKCGGRCVDYLNDPKNCNACGRQCPEACMGGSCVSNAYKYGP